jgi:cytochrome P450
VPERWRDNAHRDKFFPFGTGVRTCNDLFFFFLLSSPLFFVASPSSLFLLPFLSPFSPCSSTIPQGIGQSMALQEIKLMLAALIRRFEFRLRDENVTVVPIQEVTIKPRGGVHLIFTQRAK